MGSQRKKPLRSTSPSWPSLLPTAPLLLPLQATLEVLQAFHALFASLWHPCSPSASLLSPFATPKEGVEREGGKGSALKNCPGIDSPTALAAAMRARAFLPGILGLGGRVPALWCKPRVKVASPNQDILKCRQLRLSPASSTCLYKAWLHLQSFTLLSLREVCSCSFVVEKPPASFDCDSRKASSSIHVQL